MSSLGRLRGPAAVFAALLLVGCGGPEGKQGLPGPAGSAGPTGVPGPAGSAGPSGLSGDAGALQLVNDVTGTVVDGNGPLAGVTVTVGGGGATSTTDTTGAFSLPRLGIGAYQLTVHLAGYVDQSVPVSVTLSGPTRVQVVLAVVGSDGGSVAGGPTVTTTDQLLVGYKTPVGITGTATGSGTLTYAWTQLTGPDVTTSWSGATTAVLSFTTQDFAAAMGPVATANARFGMLGINADEAGNYSFKLTVTDSLGRATASTVLVNATRPTTGLRDVPIGVPVWLQGDGALMASTAPVSTDGGVRPSAQTTWNWKLDTSAAPNSKAAIGNPSSQFPSFTPDVLGTYVVTETVSNQTINVYSGTWVGAMDTPAQPAPAMTSQETCMLCHSTSSPVGAPNLFDPWKGTKHYSAAQRKLDGVAGAGFSEQCLTCHTVGYDKSATNGGFDDVEASTGWKFPPTLKSGNWAALSATPGLGQLAGIQCENCHGPQSARSTGAHPSDLVSAVGRDVSAARTSWSSDVCASCHQEAPHHYKPQQWALGKHSDRTLALTEATVEARATTAAHCGRCHSAQGFAQYAIQLKAGVIDNITLDNKALAADGSNASTTASLAVLGLTRAMVEAQTCSACHDPHDATNPSQLRLNDGVPALPNGLKNLSGAGTGMVCIACHNTRNGEHTDIVSPVLTSFSAPHNAAQADTLYGFNAYFVSRFSPAAHLAVADTCAGCHYAVTTASLSAAKQTSNHSFVVDNTLCATCHSANMDGQSFESRIDGDLNALRSLFATKTLSPIKTVLNTATSLLARAFDPAQQLYSSTSASNVIINSVPTSVDFALIPSSNNAAALVLHLPTPVTVQWVDSLGANVGAPVPVTNLTVTLSSLKVDAMGSTPVFASYGAMSAANAANEQLLYKAYWNMYLLTYDNTHGVHNPGFYGRVIAATSAQLQTLP